MRGEVGKNWGVRQIHFTLCKCIEDDWGMVKADYCWQAGEGGSGTPDLGWRNMWTASMDFFSSLLTLISIHMFSNQQALKGLHHPCFDFVPLPQQVAGNHDLQGFQGLHCNDDDDDG